MRIHYLGHASFVLRFENGLSLLMDYGVSNAYGRHSPVFAVSGAEPSIVTFSHDHLDHRRPDALFSAARVLDGGGDLALDGLTIRSIPTSETSMDVADNSSFLVTYGGFKVLHLGDAQAYIAAIDDPVVKHRVKARYPDKYDLVLMTIEGSSEITAEAAAFLDLLAPARAIPMHYWREETKADFLAELRNLNRVSRGAADRFTIAEPGGSDFSLYADPAPFGTKVISLVPSPLYLPHDGVSLGRTAAARAEAELALAARTRSGVEAAGSALRGRVAAIPPRCRPAAALQPVHRPAASPASPVRDQAVAGVPRPVAPGWVAE